MSGMENRLSILKFATHCVANWDTLRPDLRWSNYSTLKTLRLQIHALPPHRRRAHRRNRTRKTIVEPAK